MFIWYYRGEHYLSINNSHLSECTKAVFFNVMLHEEDTCTEVLTNSSCVIHLEHITHLEQMMQYTIWCDKQTKFWKSTNKRITRSQLMKSHNKIDFVTLLERYCSASSHAKRIMVIYLSYAIVIVSHHSTDVSLFWFLLGNCRN